MKSYLKISYLLAIFIFIASPIVHANEFGVAESKLNMINSKVDSMSYSELLDSRSSLLKERSDLKLQNDNTQSPSQRKANDSRLAEISAELSAIQKAIVAVVGVAALSALSSDDSSPDTLPPVLTIAGSTSVTVELGDVYTDAGATAADANDGVVTVTTVSNVDTSAVGSYTVTYTATDVSGNKVSGTRSVEVVDTTAPVITLVGDASVNAELGGGSYSDGGATAADASGDITVTTTGTVDTTTVGTYTLTYTASDASGNDATAVTRTVVVADTTAPVITLVGDASVNAELGGSYTDAGANATDLPASLVSGDRVTVTTTGTVDTSTVGTYTLTYTATDTSGNENTATRTVTVADTTAPVFTSSATFTVDEGATAVGTVTATDLPASLVSGDRITFSMISSVVSITSDGVLTFIEPANYEGDYITSILPPSSMLYNGIPSSFTETVTATDASANVATQVITININDFGGIDDNPNTGTATGTTTLGTGTGTSTGTGTGTGTGT
jgi:hypothetical protein